MSSPVPLESTPLLFFCVFPLSCRHLTATTTEAVAALVTVPEATLLCHTAIWQSVASFLPLLLPPQLLSPSFPVLSLSLLADRHLSKTRGQSCLNACWPISTVWWMEYKRVQLMQWMGVYSWQPFCRSLIPFFPVGPLYTSCPSCLFRVSFLPPVFSLVFNLCTDPIPEIKPYWNIENCSIRTITSLVCVLPA